MADNNRHDTPAAGRIRRLGLWVWGIATGALGLAFVVGILFWGGFNTAMEWTNREAFCIGCHEMKENVYVEYRNTIHYQNRTGVRATCPDCHVPKEWVPKIIRKVQASNEVLHKVLGSIEYACKVAGAKLILVMGHTLCGAVTSAVTLKASGQTAEEATGCQHIGALMGDIQDCVDPVPDAATLADPVRKAAFVDQVAELNVQHTIDIIQKESAALAALLADGSIAITGAMYDVSTGSVRFLSDEA